MKNLKIIDSIVFEKEQYVVFWDDETKKVSVHKGAIFYDDNKNIIDTLKFAENEEEAKLQAENYLNGKIP
jgi:hypothetical protein